MVPRISFGLIVIAIFFYVVGARWPMLAQKFGAA